MAVPVFYVHWNKLTEFPHNVVEIFLLVLLARPLWKLKLTRLWNPDLCFITAEKATPAYLPPLVSKKIKIKKQSSHSRLQRGF